MITTINEFRQHINNNIGIQEKTGKSKAEYKSMLLQYLQYQPVEYKPGRLSIIKVKGDTLRSLIFGKLSETMPIIKTAYDYDKIYNELVILKNELKSTPTGINKDISTRIEKMQNAGNFETDLNNMFRIHVETKKLDTFNKIIKYFDPTFDAVQDLKLPLIKFKTGPTHFNKSYKETLPTVAWGSRKSNNRNLYDTED